MASHAARRPSLWWMQQSNASPLPWLCWRASETFVALCLRAPRVLSPFTSTRQLKHSGTSIRTSRTSASSHFLGFAGPHHRALVGDGMKIRATSTR
jgi:hypothetical protein